MKKIMFLMPNLGNGGAERIVCYLANGFSNIGNCEVQLLLLSSDGNDYLKNLNNRVSVNYFEVKGRIRYNIHKLIKMIINRKPDIFFTGYDILNIYLAPFIPILKNNGIKVIVRETNIISKRFKSNMIKRLLYRFFYNHYDHIICQSKDMAEDLINRWRITDKKITIINNPVDIKSVQQNSLIPLKDTEVVKSSFFIAIGRLTIQKGFDHLIDLIGILDKKKKFPYKLLILGEGDLRNSLEQRISNLGLTDKVILMGRLDNPYPIMSKAKGVILSSKFEGFPNVLLEANALGIPIFSNRCPGGINEIIVENINGITAEFKDLEEFEEKYEVFLNTRFEKEKIINLTRDKYDFSVIFPQYVKLFLNS